MWLVRLVINQPIFLLMFEAFIVVLGLIGYSKIGIEQYPEVDPPVITVTTEYPGADPESIETLVTKKLEEEINQIGGINQMISTTKENISQIVVEFSLEVDARRAKTEVQDKVSRARSRLPREVEEPLVQRLDFADRPILQLALVQNKTSEVESSAFIREYADQIIKPKLQQIDGVGQVYIYGGDEREILISLDRQKLLLWKETPSSVAAAIRKNNLNVPAGNVKEEPINRGVRVIGEYRRVSDIKNTIVKTLPGGRSVKISDLGEVRDDLKELSSYARLNGKDVIFLEMKKQSGTNTVQVSERIFDFLEENKSKLSHGIEMVPIFDGAKKIRMSVNDVMETLLIASLLTIIVVYLSLGSLQSTFITAAAFPTTFIGAFFVLFWFGFTLNIMTLLGLTLSVGLILDDAIVVRENIWTKIESGMSSKEASLLGTKEVFVAVLATSFTILAVFIPVTMVPGIVGRFFSAFAITMCIAIILSTFDALTMAPMLSAYLVRSKDIEKHKKKNFVLSFFGKAGSSFVTKYQKVLRLALNHSKKTLAIASMIFISSLFLMKFVGFTFMPAAENGEFDITLEAPPGTTIKKTNEIALQVEGLVKQLPELDLYSTKVGNDLGDVNQLTVYVRLIHFSDRERGTADIKEVMRKKLLGLVKRENLIMSVKDTGSPGGGRNKPVAVAVKGPDVGVLYTVSQDIIREAQKTMPKIHDLATNLKPGKEEVRFTVDGDRAAEFSVNASQIGHAVRGLYKGEAAGSFRQSGQEYDIWVRMNASDRQSITDLGQFTIPNKRGESIPISAVTTKSIGKSPSKIIRINQQRSSLIEADLSKGAALGSVIKKMTGIIKSKIPEGYTFEFLGQAKNLKDLAIGGVTAIVLGALFIYMIMASLYNSTIIPFSILLTLPLAIVGAIVSLFLARVNLDVYSVIGVLLLMGIVTKNAILLVDYIEQLRKKGVERDVAIYEAGVRRLRPIMMTAISTIVGMLPIALGYGELNKIRAGMGISIIGGMISSTFLSLIVVPCAYIYLDNFKQWATNLVKRVYN